jgi:signal peptidase I
MKVDGISMEPTFYDGSVIFVNKVFSNINKDDIVLFYHKGIGHRGRHCKNRELNFVLKWKPSVST